MKKRIALGLAGLVMACSSTHRLTQDLRTQPTYTDHMTGVALYDPVRRKALIQHNANTPFTPASNTKLFSFYAGILTLPDSLPALRYVVRNDSLIFWGTGNPLLLHPDLPDTTTLAFLRKRPERLFFSSANYDDLRFGPGWSWDDYNDYYSTELAPFPIYGNVTRFENGHVVPRRFADSLYIAPDANQLTSVRRKEFANQFSRPSPKAERQDVPFRWSAQLVTQLLADTLHRTVEQINWPLPNATRLLRGTPTDSLYKRMLQVSDNQFAEQIFFMMSAERGSAKLEPAKELHRVADSVLHYPAASAKWVDGSGLSRYNLFTPNVLIDLLSRIYRQVPQARLFTLLPAAGQSGTLQSIDMPGKPYIFAKSGSMSGVYNLSGYIITKRDRLLYFSIMHNNFTQPVSEMRQRTADLLKRIHETY